MVFSATVSMNFCDFLCVRHGSVYYFAYNYIYLHNFALLPTLLTLESIKVGQNETFDLFD